MLETKVQTKVAHWIKANYHESAVFEYKSAREDYISYSVVVPHQIEGLWNAKHLQVYLKLPDVGVQWPFDGINVSGVPAFVVIRYPSGVAYGIDIDDFIRQRDSSSRKSLTEAEAELIHSFKLA